MNKRESIDLMAKFYIVREAVEDNYLPDEVVNGVLWVLDGYNQKGEETVSKDKIIEESFDKITQHPNFYGSTEKVHPCIKRTLEYFVSKEIISKSNGDIIFPLRCEKYLNGNHNKEKNENK